MRHLNRLLPGLQLIFNIITMHVRKLVICLIVFSGLIAGCRKLDTRRDLLLTEANIVSDYRQLWSLGYGSYTRLTHGFNLIDDNLFTAVSDEAEQTAPSSEAQLFNQGTWNAFNNPDNIYANHYEGIRAANYFLERSVNYKTILHLN